MGRDIEILYNFLLQSKMSPDHQIKKNPLASFVTVTRTLGIWCCWYKKDQGYNMKERWKEKKKIMKKRQKSIFFFC